MPEAPGLSLPNALSLLRLLLCPAMLIVAWEGWWDAFLACLAASLVSDALDGWVARRFHSASTLGSRLDSWGDFALCMSAPLSVWWLWPERVRHEALFVAIVVGAYLVPVLLGFLKYHRLTSYHTWAAKGTAVLLGCSILLWLLGGPAGPFRFAALVLCLAEAEEIAITLLLPEWTGNVPSFLHARRLRHARGATMAQPENEFLR